MLFESIMSPNAEWRASVKGGEALHMTRAVRRGGSGGQACPRRPRTDWAATVHSDLWQKWPSGYRAGQQRGGLWWPRGRPLTPAVFRALPQGTDTTDTSWTKEKQSLLQGGWTVGSSMWYWRQERTYGALSELWLVWGSLLGPGRNEGEELIQRNLGFESKNPIFTPGVTSSWLATSSQAKCHCSKEAPRPLHGSTQPAIAPVFGGTGVQIFCFCLNWVVVFSWSSFVSSLSVLVAGHLSGMHFANISYNSVACLHFLNNVSWRMQDFYLEV